MILLVLLAMIVGMGLVIFAAWKLLGGVGRLAVEAGLGKSVPVLGFLSVVTTVLAFLGVVTGIGLDSHGGEIVAIFAMFVGPVVGICFGAAGIFTRERPIIVPVVGLLGSVMFALFFLLR